MFQIKAATTRKIVRSSVNLSYQIACLQGIGTRNGQEDSFGLSDYQNIFDVQKNGLLAVLADGMGGMTDGKRVSHAAVNMCLDLFSPFMPDIPNQLIEGVRLVNRHVYEQFGGNGGTTLIAAKIYEENLWWSNIGDSGIFLKRGNLLFRLNKIQNYRNQLYLDEIFQRAVVDKSRVESDIDAERLSEFIGNSDLDELDYSIRPLKLEENDVIFLCSDGISNSIDEINIAMALNYSPERACTCLEALISEARRPNQDNYTAIIIRCTR